MDQKDRRTAEKWNLMALRRTFFCVLGLVWVVGTMFYAWKWGFDFTIFEQDSGLLRGKFGFANHGTAIKPIDWKARYYRKVDRIKQLSMELMHVKDNLQHEMDEAEDMDMESKALQEENLMMMAQNDYLEEELKQELVCNDTESRKNSTRHKGGPHNKIRSNHSRITPPAVQMS